MSLKLKSKNYKIVLLGKGCVGKTSLLLRYCENKFNENNLSTIQASFSKKELSINGTLVNLFIWDTAGQEIFHALGPFYYRNSNGAVIVYDITELESLLKAKLWIQELRSILGESVCLALVGNKCDLLDKQHNTLLTPVIVEAMAYCKTLNNIEHYCTSAKSNKGVNEMFLDLTKRMIMQENESYTNQNFPSSFNNRKLQINEDDDELKSLNLSPKKCNC